MLAGVGGQKPQNCRRAMEAICVTSDRGRRTIPYGMSAARIAIDCSRAILKPEPTPNLEEVTMVQTSKGLEELFHDTLKDIYFAEKRILATLPKISKAAQSSELKSSFEKHYGETEEHLARLEQVFAAIDSRPQGTTCDAIVGMTNEGAEVITEYKGSAALDAGLLAAAQAVEHYEISGYGTLKSGRASLS
jgi:ferritin-like metal-binding protein YciE